MISAETQTVVPIEVLIEHAQSQPAEIRDTIIDNLRRNPGNLTVTDQGRYFEGADGVGTVVPLMDGLRGEVQAQLEAGWTYRGVLESDLSKLAGDPLGVRQEIYGKLEPPEEEEDPKAEEPGAGSAAGGSVDTRIPVSRPLDSPRPVRQQQSRRPQRFEPLWQAPENAVTPEVESVTEAADNWGTVAHRLVSMRAHLDDPRARLDLVTELEHKAHTPDEVIALSEGDSIARERAGAGPAEVIGSEEIAADASDQLTEKLTENENDPDKLPRARTDESVRSVPTEDDESETTADGPGELSDGRPQDNQLATEVTAEVTDTPLAYPAGLALEVAPQQSMAASDAPEQPFGPELPLGLEPDPRLAASGQSEDDTLLPAPEGPAPDHLGATAALPRLEQPAVDDKSDRDRTPLLPERSANDRSNPKSHRQPELVFDPGSQAVLTSGTIENQDNRLAGEPIGPLQETIPPTLSENGSDRLSGTESDPDELLPSGLDMPEWFSEKPERAQLTDGVCVRLETGES